MARQFFLEMIRPLDHPKIKQLCLRHQRILIAQFRLQFCRPLLGIAWSYPVHQGIAERAGCMDRFGKTLLQIPEIKDSRILERLFRAFDLAGQTEPTGTETHRHPAIQAALRLRQASSFEYPRDTSLKSLRWATATPRTGTRFPGLALVRSTSNWVS